MSSSTDTRGVPEVVEQAIRLYLATVQLCWEKRFDAFSYKCVDGVENIKVVADI